MRLRPPTRADADRILEIIVARDVADVGEPDYTLEDLFEEWEMDGFDVAVDAVVAEDDGRVVGYAAMRPDVSHGYVPPEEEGRGIGSALVEWCERRAVERGARRHRQTIGVANERARALFTGRGYEHVRSYWRMIIDSDAAAGEPPPPPDGFTARALDPEADARPLFAVNERAFATVAHHDGAPLEQFVDEHLRVRSLDPSLSVVAERDGAVVAFALCRRWEDEGRGYIDLLGVDPDAAGRGLGSWLLKRVFASCAAAGLRQTMLGVASDNPRAAELYERAGMRVHFRLDDYQRAATG